MSGAIEAVRGMRDVLPDEQRRLAWVRHILEAAFESYGYEPIDLPIIEDRDLYLRKLGEELAGKVYEFSFGGRDLALRPEWTASVLRVYVNRLQDRPLPLRLYYSGPVFRYELSRSDAARQFTQVGIEMIGGPPPYADAEALVLACTGLEAVGVRNYRIRAGHVGLVREVLAQFALSERTRGALVWNVERLREEGPQAVRTYLEERLDTPSGLELPPGLDEQRARAWLLSALQAMQIELSTGTRPLEQVVDRLLRKLHRQDEHPALEQALALLEQLVVIRGPASQALPALAALLEEHGLRAATLTKVRAVLAAVTTYGRDPDQIELDFGFSRGLHYYTGLIFEIIDAAGRPIGGGGRYDELVSLLGGQRHVPAVGFAYTLEQVAAAADPPAPPRRRQALVAPVTGDDYAYAQEIARRLREQGLAVSVDVCGRTVEQNLNDAAQRGVRFVAVVGVEERSDRTFVWHDLERRDERRIRLDTMEEIVR